MKFFFTRLFKKSSNKNQPNNTAALKPEPIAVLPTEEGATVAAYQMKLWCDKNLSPVAWARVILRNLPYFNSKGFSLANLQNPPADLVLNPETFSLLKDTIERVYGVEYFESKKTFV